MHLTVSHCQETTLPFCLVFSPFVCHICQHKFTGKTEFRVKQPIHLITLYPEDLRVAYKSIHNIFN